jgi:6,7-dimethyl-8-ribityllumazine synthase
MLQDLQIGRWGVAPKDADKLASFLEAIGFRRVYESKDEKHSALFAAPRGVLGINMLSEQPELAPRLITVGVANPDVVFDIARKFNFKVLKDFAHSESASRVFMLELPGEIVLSVVGGPTEPPSGLEGRLDAKGRRFAVILSRFNAFITERLLHGTLDALTRSGARRNNINIVRVPGAFEIPLAARKLAETKKYDAIICLGCLLRGDTAHYDVIVNEVTRGIGQSAQETGVPHAFGVLTCETLEQAIDRAGLKIGNKGFEAALAAVEMASLKEAISRQPSAVNKKQVSPPRSASRRNDKLSGRSKAARTKRK